MAADASFQTDVSSEVAQKLQRIVGSSLGNVTAAAKKGRSLADFSLVLESGGREVHPSNPKKTIPDRVTTTRRKRLTLAVPKDSCNLHPLAKAYKHKSVDELQHALGMKGGLELTNACLDELVWQPPSETFCQCGKFMV